MEGQLRTRLAPLAPWTLAVFRIVFGLLFLCHGTSKLFAWPTGTATPFGTWPYWYAGVIEMVAGALIALGLFTRIAAFFASGEMAFAYFTAHAPDGFWPIANHGEDTVMYCFAFLLLVAVGPGALALDAAFGSRQPDR